MQRFLTWQKLFVLALIIGSIGIGGAVHGPSPVHAEPHISATITIDNTASDLDLVGVDAALIHGEWTNDVQPPSLVKAGTTATFEAENEDPVCSCTGTEGYVDYLPRGAPDGKTIRFYWDVPETCCNTADTSAPPGCTSVQSKPIDGGDHPDVTFSVKCLSKAGDGIADVWKLNGAAFDDGTGTNTKAFVDLPSMGANVNRKQIYLQIDWMQDATHNQQLTAAAIKKVADSFAAHNIDLIVDEGPASTNRATGQAWGSLSKAQQLPWQATLGTLSPGGAYLWTQFDNFRDGANGVACPSICFKQTGRRPIFHYVIAANTIPGGNSGISPSGGVISDLIVSLGGGNFTGPAGSDNEQAGTLMHELGHNLGLDHGGTDGVNKKPNYLSVMNYLFQFKGVQKSDGTATFDYSESQLPSLFESLLNESNGIGAAAAGFATYHWCPGGTPANPGTTGKYISVPDGSKPIAWGCEAKATPGKIVQADVNGDSICVEPGPNGTLETKASGNDTVDGAQILIGGSGTNRKCSTTAYSSDDLGPDAWISAYLSVGGLEPFELVGASDWDKLQLKNGDIGGSGVPQIAAPTVHHDPTAQDQRNILPLDTTPPVTTESESATPPRNAAGWYRSNVTVTLSATDDTVVALTEYNLDGSGWTTYISPVVVSTDGVHSFQYRSVDASQNEETAKTATIKIDKTAPSVSLTGFTANGQNGWLTSKSAAGGVQATDNLSGLASVTCADDLNGLSPSALSPNGALSVTQPLTITQDGVHHLTCTATDAADNTATTPTLTVKVDSTPPACTAVATPSSLWPPNQKLDAVSVSISASDAGSGLQSVTGVQASSNEDNADIASNVKGLTVSQSYQPTGPDLTGPARYQGTTSGQVRAERDGDGSGRTYTLTYAATDMAGNVGTCAATVVVPHDQGG